MKTRVYTKNDLLLENVKQDIKETLLSGKNVIFPTETVYGIGAYALSSEGVNGIYEIKGRPSDNPLIMHVNEKEDILPYIIDKQDYTEDLMNAFWPGPLTMVFRKNDIVPKNITGGLDTVAIRIPSNEIARYVIKTAGVPICAPSANISGRPSSTLIEHVLEDFNDRVDIVIDGGKSEIGLESTVVDVTGDIPIVLRPGMITSEMIKEVVGDVKIAHPIKQSDIPKSPGMKYKHYAPKGDLTIVKGKSNEVIKYINNQIKLHKKQKKKVGVISTVEYLDLFDTEYVSSIGGKHNEMEIASNLFVVLREMDQHQVDYIYSMSFHKGMYQEAIMNRLYKAANNKVVKVRQRCNWGKSLETSKLYQEYHDNQWGVAVYDDRLLFEMLVLESFHVGLSWLIILRKREAFKKAFDNFDAEKIVQYDKQKIEELLHNKDIVRHKGKINATISNAEAYLKVKEEFGSFSNYIWSFTENKIINKENDEWVTTNDLSDRVTKDLKKRGFKFLGSVTVYSYLEAIGVMNNHTRDCFKHHKK